jgi:hypothetical protein
MLKRNSPQLTHVDLSKNTKIGIEGAKLLGDSLLSNTTLIYLNIGEINTQ